MHTKFILYEYQISGKQPKLISNDKKQILKGYKQKQAQFYEKMEKLNITDNGYNFKKWIPKYHGTLSLDKPPIIETQHLQNGSSYGIWLQHIKNRYEKRNPHNKFIILQNIVNNFSQVCAMDIKIGLRPTKQKKIKKFIQINNLKLNGIKVHQKKNNNKQFFMSKYYLQMIEDQYDCLKHLSFFFYDGVNIKVNIIQSVILQLNQIVLELRTLRYINFISSSVYIAYDPNTSEVKVKFIDFGRIMLSSKDDYDHESCCGIQKIINFLHQILKKIQQLQMIIQNKDIRLFENDMIIPENKIKQYQLTTVNNQDKTHQQC